MEIIVKKDKKIKDLYNEWLEYDENEKNDYNLDYEYPKKIVIYIDNYYKFAFDTHFGNCKVCILQNLQSCLQRNFDKTIERLDELFELINKLIFISTFTSTYIIEELSKVFKPLYITKVPIGYDEECQYHCGFLLNCDYPNKNEYLERIKEEKIELINLE